MDKYEYKLKLDELTELFQLKNYKGAAEIADEINWTKVRNAKTLCMVADVYEALERYDSCQDVLMQAYDHSSVGRNIVSRLTDIAIKSKDIESAEEYYNEFMELAPRDTQGYVFAYKIACLKNAPLGDRIAILEEFKEKEYSEMWAYELAVLYAQAGMREKCVETCDELILWFGDGEYVERALDLKRSFQPLTASQEEKYQSLLSQRGMVEINIPQKGEASADQVSANDEEVPSPDLIVTATKFNTQNLQAEISRSMQQIMEATEENTVRDRLNSIKKIVQDIPYLEGAEEVAASKREQIQEEVDQGLKSDFQEKLVEETVYGHSTIQNEGMLFQEDTSGMSIEEILADWEKTKVVAKEAMAAAEQKKLDLEKEQALAEADEIMRRLQELMPILSATPGEDIPDSNEGTVADELLSAEPIVLTPPEEREPLTPKEKDEDDAFFLDLERTGKMPFVSSPNGWTAERKMAGVESLDDWSEEDEKALEQTLAQGLRTDDIAAETKAAAVRAAADAAAAADVRAAAADIGAAATADVRAAAADIGAAADATAAADVSAAAADIGAAAAAADMSAAAADIGAAAAAADMSAAAADVGAAAKAAAADVGAAAGAGKEDEYFDEEEDLEAAPKTGEADFTSTRRFDMDGAFESLMGQADQFAADSGAGVSRGIELTDDVKALFSYFIPIPGMAEQISVTLGDTVRYKEDAVNSSKGNVIVQGEEGSGKTMLATELIKAAQQTMDRGDDRIGKISAEALNTRDFSSLVPKIGGGYLIIEDAGSLDENTVASMVQVMSRNTGGMTVILEDDSAGIRRVLGTNPDFAAMFTSRVKIPIFTIDELVDFGKAYALEQECEIEEMAVLALYNRINNIQKVDHPTTLSEVKEIVDEAINSAESASIKKLFAKKYNDEDFLILHEEDFG